MVNLTIRRDIGVVRDGLTGVSEEEKERWQSSKFDKYVKNWNGDTKKELALIKERLGRLSPIIVLAYALVMTFYAFDQIMSVDPHWYSTMFGGHIFMSGVYLAFAWVAMLILFLRRMHPLFLAKIERRTLHDLGKLLFGFGIFWAYLFWCHYLPIWYGNIPEETGWIIDRFREEPWHTFSWVVLGMCFIIPFFLGLSRDVKQVPILLFFTAFIASIGIWLQQFLLFLPTHSPHIIPIGIMDMGISIGFMGAYLLSVVSFLEKYPIMPFGDFYED